jgi:GNAT superfamily N-acetyltransferase
MQDAISYRQLLKGDEEGVSRLVEEVFDEFIAPDYDGEGIVEFKRNILAEDLLRRHLSGESFIMIAEEGGEPVGVIDIRDGSHIRLFFVRRDYQGKGVGGRLLQLAVERLRWENPGLDAVTVNSSPYAIPIYQRMGFEATQPEQVKNGIRHTPMTLLL